MTLLPPPHPPPVFRVLPSGEPDPDPSREHRDVKSCPGRDFLPNAKLPSSPRAELYFAGDWRECASSTDTAARVAREKRAGSEVVALSNEAHVSPTVVFTWITFNFPLRVCLSPVTTLVSRSRRTPVTSSHSDFVVYTITPQKVAECRELKFDAPVAAITTIPPPT